MMREGIARAAPRRRGMALVLGLAALLLLMAFGVLAARSVMLDLRRERLGQLETQADLALRSVQLLANVGRVRPGEAIDLAALLPAETRGSASVQIDSSGPHATATAAVRLAGAELTVAREVTWRLPQGVAIEALP